MDATRGPGVDSLKVSVVIPTYNRAGLLGEAIESVVRQNYPHREVLVVDDGSTDSTAEVVARFGSAVRYIRQHNAGAAAARNHGIRLATGELVAFLDSDDLFLPGKLQKQVQYIRQHPETVLVYSRFGILDGEGRTRPGRRCDLTGNVSRELLARCMQGPIATPTVMVRRDVLLAAGGFDESMHLSEDVDLWCRIARLGPIGLVPETLVTVRRHDGNLSRSPGRKKYVAAALRIIDKACAADPEMGRLLALRLRAKAHLWGWLVDLGGLLPAGLSFWLRTLLTNPRAAFSRERRSVERARLMSRTSRADAHFRA